MSVPRSLSIGVSSFSFNQDLIKLRQCLGSTEPDKSGDESDASISSQKSTHPPLYSENRLENYQLSQNVISVSQISTTHTSDNSSVETENSGSPSKQHIYLKDHSTEAALVTNEMYQEALKEAIARLNMALVRNLERQSEVQYELDHSKEQKDYSSSSNEQIKVKTMHWLVLCAPYLKDLDGFPFPENADAKYKRLKHEISPYVTETQKWTKHEQALLYSAVKSNVKRNLAEPFLQRKEIICNKLKNEDLSSEVIKQMKSKLLEITSDLDTTLKLPDHEIMRQSTESADWMRISTVEFEGLRSAECCEIMWNNSVNPKVSKGSWTKDEDNRLVDIVQKYEFQNWDAIAKELGNRRTAEQCIKRYNGHLNHEMVQKGYWTPEENSVLRELVEELRVGDRIPWGKVSSYLKSRHPGAVRKHWQRTLNHEIKKGSWSLEEDVILVMGVKKYGTKFYNICPLLPGRTYLQCRERYHNSLSMDISFEKWSREEDMNVIYLAKMKGTKWAEIAEQVPGRTHSMVRQRYTVILKNIPDAYERVEQDISEWPYTPSHNNFRSISRRSIVYDHIANRSKVLSNQQSGRLPKMRRTVSKVKNLSSTSVNCVHSATGVNELNEEVSSELHNPKHVEFILNETKNIIRQKVKPITPQIKKKVICNTVVDNALDSLLFPSIVCRKSGLKKGLALKGKESIEYDFCRTHMLKALNMPQDKEDTGSGFSCEGHQLPAESVSTGDNLKGKKLDMRRKFFSHGVQQTILNQCLGNVNKANSYSVLPPMKPSVNAFKLMVMDRNRIIELASSVEDASLILKITETPAGVKIKCAAHSNIQLGNASTLLATIKTETCDVNNESHVNSTTLSNSENCGSCLQLQRLHTKYSKFKNMFISMFFWPAQMYLVPPPDASIDPSPEHFVKPQIKKIGRKRKRGGSVRKKNVTDDVCSTDVIPPRKKMKPRKPKELNTCPVRYSTRKAKKDS